MGALGNIGVIIGLTIILGPIGFIIGVVLAVCMSWKEGHDEKVKGMEAIRAEIQSLKEQQAAAAVTTKPKKEKAKPIIPSPETVVQGIVREFKELGNEIFGGKKK